MHEDINTLIWHRIEQTIKLSIDIILLSLKMDTSLKLCIRNGTFELTTSSSTVHASTITYSSPLS